MPAERFYIDDPLTVESEVILDEVESHHLIHVLRGTTGESVELVNGRGTLAKAKILFCKKKEARLAITSAHFEFPAPAEIILAQAIPRPNRLDFIVEKGTELGMTQLWLFPGIQGERLSLTAHQIERCHQQARSAMKQCGRRYLPTITVKPLLSKWECATPYISLYGSLASDAPKVELSSEDLQKGIVFYIGPESGFAPQEIDILEKRGARGVKLHSHILRTDTAALSALSIISYLQLI
jgi:16S rRNA (uracil1498-N3)-methyltransferase